MFEVVVKEVLKLLCKIEEALLVVFVVLKLAKLVTWSWLWILSPFWIGCTIVLFAMVLIIIVKKLR
jgi:hypothetical protein